MSDLDIQCLTSLVNILVLCVVVRGKGDSGHAFTHGAQGSRVVGQGPPGTDCCQQWVQALLQSKELPSNTGHVLYPTKDFSVSYP